MNELKAWFSGHKAVSFVFMGTFTLIVMGLSLRCSSGSTDQTTAPLKKGSIIESVYGIGTVTATKTYQIRPGVTSTVMKIFIREGDSVKKGEKLVVMDPYTVFTAPFDGTITFLPVKVGENVFSQAVILTVVDLTDRYLVVSLEQQGALRVREGQKAKLSFDSLRNESFDGVVESVYSNDNNFLVRIGVQKLPPQILPGMTVDVAIGINERHDVLLAPVAAVEDGKVYVQRGSKRGSPVSIKLGVVDGAMAEITSGDVHEGDVLLIRKKVTP